MELEMFQYIKIWFINKDEISLKSCQYCYTKKVSETKNTDYLNLQLLFANQVQVI